MTVAWRPRARSYRLRRAFRGIVRHARHAMVLANRAGRRAAHHAFALAASGVPGPKWLTYTSGVKPPSARCTPSLASFRHGSRALTRALLASPYPSNDHTR